MQIILENSYWIEIEKDDDNTFTLSFDGDNGNSVVVGGIKMRHLKQLLRDIKEKLEGK